MINPKVEKFLYEVKPLIIFIVGILALFQLDDESSFFEISGFLMILASIFVFYLRIKHRGFLFKFRDKK